MISKLNFDILLFYSFTNTILYSFYTHLYLSGHQFKVIQTA